MNSLVKAALGFFTLLLLTAPAGAENLLSGKIGFAWPQALMASAPSGDAEIAYGKIVDRKIAYGVAADFLWNVNSKIARLSGSTYQTISEQQVYMFPVMFFFQADPIPDLIVHPVAHFDIGYNSLIYSYSGQNARGSTPLHPYFYGLIIKAGGDALYDMGERSSLYLGLEYQWATTSTASSSSGISSRLDMSGLGLSGGFRVML